MCRLRPAGTTDILARLIGQWLSERLGQQFVIENRPGASTIIGTEAVVRAPADGYTLLLATPSSAINATLFEKLSYNFLRDIAPVAGIMRVPNVMVVHPSVPAKSVAELVADDDERGWLDGERAVMESLIGFKRAGADGVLTYAAVEAARRLKAG